MNDYGTMEITTVIGCKVQCKFCPQQTLTTNYVHISRNTVMSFDTYQTCIDKIPNYVQIDFSGMAEPWLNPKCTDMVLYAAEKGHPIAIYTTLVGMTKDDFDRIKHIPFSLFRVHIPDNNNNTRIPVTPDYLSLLAYVTNFFNQSQYRNVYGASCHGMVHPAVWDAIGENAFDETHNLGIENTMIDRSGLIEGPDVLHSFHEGSIMCMLSTRLLNHNILLPNGDVLLCCNDYSMDYVIGNLVVSDYQSLFTSGKIRKVQEAMEGGSLDLICTRCHWATPSKARIQSFKPEEFTSLGGKGKIYEFAIFLANHTTGSNILIFDDIASVQLGGEYSKNDIVIIPNAIYSLERSPQLVEPLKRLFGSVNKTILYDDINSFPDTEKLLDYLRDNNFPVEFFGYVNEKNKKTGTMALISKSKPPQPLPTPDDFKVIAIIPTYNEEDIIVQTINQLNRDGIAVYLIDNWSVDRTFELASQLINHGVLGVERWPKSGPLSSFDNIGIAGRQEELALELDGDWFIRADADEIRESPWEGVRLRDAIYWVDKQGYNAIDFTVTNYKPVDNGFGPGIDLLDHFKYFEFSQLAGDFLQIRAWKKTNNRVNLHDWGGHQAIFPDRKIYPYKFLLRHYPLRSQSHAIKKLFQDRIPRFSAKNRQKGWHTQYDIYSPSSNFLRNPKTLIESNSKFLSDYLIERLSGIGIIPEEIEKNNKTETILAERDQEIGARNHELSEIKYSLEATTVRLVGREQELAARDLELAEIKRSKAWKLALWLRRARIMLIPPGSFSARVLKKFVGIVFSPVNKYKRYHALKNDMALVKASGLFDETWYLANNPDVAQAKVDPCKHYLVHGGFEGRDPGPNFSSKWYLDTYEDVKNAGVNPLLHFLKYGKKEGRSLKL